MLFLCAPARLKVQCKSSARLAGNKRIEGAGQLISLLFEDLFKSLNADLKRQADTELNGYHRSMASARSREAPPCAARRA